MIQPPHAFQNFESFLVLDQVWARARLGPDVTEKLVRVVAKRAAGSKRFVAIIPQRLVENDHVSRERAQVGVFGIE